MNFKFAAILLICSLLFAQENDPKIILNNVKQKLDKVNDYTADILIKIDVDFLKVDDTKAKVFFKKPNRFKMEAKGFAMIPRASLKFSPLRLLQQDFLSVYIKTDTLNSAKVEVIKLIPVEEDAKMLLASLWIDPVHFNILKIEASTRDKGTFSIFFKYGKQIQYGLPDSAIILFDVSRSRMPHFSFGQKKKKGALKGRVEIIYSHYKVNEGLDENIFLDETEEELD